MEGAEDFWVSLDHEVQPEAQNITLLYLFKYKIISPPDISPSETSKNVVPREANFKFLQLPRTARSRTLPVFTFSFYCYNFQNKTA